MVINLIPSCLRGSALTWWTVEVDDIARELVERSTIDYYLNQIVPSCINRGLNGLTLIYIQSIGPASRYIA